MPDDFLDDYLTELTASQREVLVRINGPGLKAAREYLETDKAVSFLGAGASAPLYPACLCGRGYSSCL